MPRDSTPSNPPNPLRPIYVVDEGDCYVAHLGETGEIVAVYFSPGNRSVEEESIPIDQVPPKIMNNFTDQQIRRRQLKTNVKVLTDDEVQQWFI